MPLAFGYLNLFLKCDLIGVLVIDLIVCCCFFNLFGVLIGSSWFDLN